MSEISDKLRAAANLTLKYGSDDYNRIHNLAGRIDAEMVELPNDADGVPIHVGDTVYLDDGSKAYVERICIMANTTHVKCAFSDGRIIEFQPTELTHTRPDSFERIADELEAWCDDADVDGDACDKLRNLVERIHKLAKKED